MSTPARTTPPRTRQMNTKENAKQPMGGNVINENGLRYKKKAAAASENNPASFAATVVSCLHCSQRKSRDQMRFKILAGMRSFVCKDPCR